MTVQFTDRPDPARDDDGIAKASTRDVGTPERQDFVRDSRDARNADIDAAVPGEGTGSPSPLWERVQKYPGMVGGGVNRHTQALGMKADAGA